MSLIFKLVNIIILLTNCFTNVVQANSLDILKKQSVMKVVDIKDNNNNLYDVYLFANHFKKKVISDDDIWACAHQGDINFVGNFKFGLHQKQTSEFTISKQSALSELGRHTSTIYNIPTKTQNTSDLIAVAQCGGSVINDITIYQIKNGVIQKFENTSSTFNLTIKPKYNPKTQELQSLDYDNTFENPQNQYGYFISFQKVDFNKNRLINLKKVRYLKRSEALKWQKTPDYWIQ